MTAWESAFDETMDDETSGDPNGAYHDDPRDPGGETKWGLCKRWHKDLDIENLTKAAAEALAKRDYWEKPGFDKITSWPLAKKLFNIGFNLSPADAIRFLQDAANRLGAKLAVDGVLGPASIKWINDYKYPGALIMGMKINAGIDYFSKHGPYDLAGLLLRLSK
jgi:lysozyme family protein